MSALMINLGELMAESRGSIDPSKFPDEVFDLYSIPSYDAGQPEVISGSSIGSSKQTVQPDDVLLSKIVPHIRRSWIVGQDHGRRIIASGEWIVFRDKRIDPKYLRHVLVGDPFHSKFMSTVSGVGGSLVRARPSYVANIEVPLPPKSEQSRIAKVLDCAEELRAKRHFALAQLDSLTQAIFIEMFGDPATNPKAWPQSTLGDESEQVTDGEHLTPRRTSEGIKLLSARNIRDGYIDFDNVDFIGVEEHERIKRRCNPSPGDVLISCSGSIGRIASVRVHEPFSLVRSVALVRPKHAVLDTKYLEHYLRTPALKARMLKRANASSQANLFQAPIRALPLFMPPRDLQAQFSRRIEVVEKLRAAQSASLVQLDGLFASLQQRAFSGNL